MATAPKRIKVTPGSELARLLDEVGDRPLVLETNGELYRLDRVESAPEGPWTGYDAEAVRQAVAETAGSWADIDTDKLIADIYRWREEGSRPASRP